MKFKILMIIVVTLIFSNEALASNIEYDYATVIDAEPIFKTVHVRTPREECWEEEVAYDAYYYRDGHHNNRTGAILGGLIGAAIGNGVGHHKRNKQVGTVVGAVLGASIGNAYTSMRNRRQFVTYGLEERCRIVEETHVEERIVGYNVRYRYSNVTYSTRMKVDPGDTIKVRVSISPVI